MRCVENGDNILVFNATSPVRLPMASDFKATRVAAVNVRVHDVQRNGIKFWRGGDVVNAAGVQHRRRRGHRL